MPASGAYPQSTFDWLLLLRREPFGVPPHNASPERGGARLRRAEGFVPNAAKVAAALSAAVTTAKPIGDAHTLHGRTSP